MAKRNENESSKWKFLDAIVGGLKKEPAYLLIFAICALLFLFGLVAGIDAAVERHPERLYVSSACFVAGLVAAVIVIFKVQAPNPTVSIPLPDSTSAVLASTGNQRFDDILNAIQKGIKKALTFNNESFVGALLEECGTFRAQVADWSNGQVQTHGQYNQLLLRFYEHAESTVFSTSIPDYLSTWMGPFGEQLMDAHRKSHAVTTRVFVFNNRKEISQDALSVMASQAKSGVNVRLFFDDDNRGFRFPPDISRDFTVIDDGEAIGITLSFGGDNLAAMWYIQDTNRRQRFLRIRNSLIEGSIAFSAFENSLAKGA